MQKIRTRALIGLLAGAALVAPVAVMGAASTTRPAGAAATQPTTRPTSKADVEAIKKQLPDYPLDKCVVSGGKLGEMGEPSNYVYKGRLVRFCCSHCQADFDKNPAKYLAKIDEAAKAKRAGTATQPNGSVRGRTPSPAGRHVH